MIKSGSHGPQDLSYSIAKDRSDAEQFLPRVGYSLEVASSPGVAKKILLATIHFPDESQDPFQRPHLQALGRTNQITPSAP